MRTKLLREGHITQVRRIAMIEDKYQGQKYKEQLKN